MNQNHLRPGKIVGTYGRLYPEAWKQVDEFRARRKELGNWPERCFLPLALAHRIVTTAKTVQSPNEGHHAAILAALAAWRVTQGIYGFDPTTFDAIWKTPVSGEIPAEVLFHLPEWCVYIPTPQKTWQGANLNGFFAHLDHHLVDRRAELRLLLDLSGLAGDQLEAIAIPVARGGVAAGVEAVMKAISRQFPVTMHTLEGETEQLSNDVAPLVSLVLYLSSQSAEIREPGGGKRVPTRPNPQKTKKGLRIFPPDHPSRWEVGLGLGAALRGALSADRNGAVESVDNVGAARHDARRAGWQSFLSDAPAPAQANAATIKWLPPVPVELVVVEEPASLARGLVKH